MTVYISRDDSYALEHYGVKGMKWGVRKNYGRLGSVERLSNKQAYINQQIKRNNADTRGQKIANIYRRGRIAQIESKKSVRSARKDFMANKTKDNAKKYAKAAGKNQVKIMLGGGLGGTMIRGYAKTEKGSRQIKLGKALAQNRIEQSKKGLTKARIRYYERGANAIDRDAENLRKAGYKDEAAAVQTVADKRRRKAQQLANR